MVFAANLVTIPSTSSHVPLVFPAAETTLRGFYLPVVAEVQNIVAIVMLPARFIKKVDGYLHSL